MASRNLVPPASPMVNAGGATRAKRRRRRNGRKVAPAARASTAPAGARRRRVGEELDEQDDARLMQDILHQSYMEYIRPRMPISYLKGTSMMKHDPAPDLRPHWCHPEKTLKPRTPLWNRPVTPAKPLPSPATLDAAREREAQLKAARQAEAAAAAAAGAGTRRSAGSSGQWSRRTSSASGHRTVRNGTSLNMPSFKRLPQGHPQSILYSALFPHMPISHIQRPGSPQATSGVWKITRQKNQHVPTATLRAGFQPKYRQPLLAFEPQDDTTFTSSHKRLHTRREHDEHVHHTADVDREFRRTKGLFTDYMRDAIMKKVDYHKVGH